MPFHVISLLSSTTRLIVKEHTQNLHVYMGDNMRYNKK